MARPAISRGASLRMTGQAPAHLISGGARRISHAFHSSMAIGALQSRAEVHLMGEVDKIRKTLEPDPWNRLTLFPICQEGVGVRSLRVEVTMTTQAQLHGRNPGRG